MNKSDTLDQIAVALAKAQANIEGAAKDRSGNYGAYATLGSVVSACKSALLAEGITFLQTYEPSPDGRLCLTTTLLHTSGQFISGTCSMPLPKQDPQGFGSASTYARRQGLAAIVGVCPEDDDGHAASGGPPRQQAKPAARHQAPNRPATSNAPPTDALENVTTFKRHLHGALIERKFDVDGELRVIGAIQKKFGIEKLEALDLDQRHTVLMQIRDGNLDKFREPAREPANA